MLATELSDKQLQDIKDTLELYKETDDEMYSSQLSVYMFYFKDYDGDNEIILDMVKTLGDK